MINARRIVAHKYAQAFVRLFFNTMKPQTVESLQQLMHFFDTHPQVCFFLEMPFLGKEVKQQGLMRIANQLDLGPLLKPLFTVLLADKRLFLLPYIIKHIIDLYKTRAHIQTFTITSSHQLSPETIARLHRFLERNTDATVLYTYTIDPRLIAGIRMQSDSALWEYSIAKQLRQVEQPFIR